jgi:hypothetical protein
MAEALKLVDQATKLFAKRNKFSIILIIDLDVDLRPSV